MPYRRTILLLALLLVLVLALISTAPLHAHGGEGDKSYGPAPSWMVALIYIQLAMIPFVGIWLSREVLAAWLPRGARHGL